MIILPVPGAQGNNAGGIDAWQYRTYYGHVRTINISQLKAHISEQLRAVRKGQRLVILDRDIPVAQLVPYQQPAPALAPRAPKRAIVLRKLGIAVKTDPLEALMAERASR
jgi:antitoxin (DNA-binding transcriptional repressor) of toxin-antitoxin stability system